MLGVKRPNICSSLEKKYTISYILLKKQTICWLQVFFYLIVDFGGKTEKQLKQVIGYIFRLTH